MGIIYVIQCGNVCMLHLIGHLKQMDLLGVDSPKQWVRHLNKNI